MRQPLVLLDKRYPTHVCKLKRAIYGLRQVLLEWCNALSSFLLEYWFVNSITDKSLFLYKKDGVQTYMLIYVDDLILTRNNSTFLKKFVDALSKNFSLRNLGD